MLGNLIFGKSQIPPYITLQTSYGSKYIDIYVGSDLGLFGATESASKVSELDILGIVVMVCSRHLVFEYFDPYLE